MSCPIHTDIKGTGLALAAEGKPGPVPTEAIEYLEAKGLKPGYNYTKVWGAEHTYAFTVAKILELDVLADVKKSLLLNLQEGRSYHDWQKNILPSLDKTGWAAFTDPKQQPHRLRNIYKSNMRVARAVGQWQRIERTQRTHPYLRYMLGPSTVHRQEHVGWAGMVLRADDPWFDEHMPPNGWGCNCWVMQLTKRDAERYGISDSPEVEYEEWVHEESGISYLTPKGVDPGWNYNPGKLRAQTLGQALDLRENTAPGPSASYPNSGAMVRALIMDGKLSNKDILAAAQAQFGITRTDPQYVAWYRSDLKKKGLNPPTAPKVSLVKPPTPEPPKNKPIEQQILEVKPPPEIKPSPKVEEKTSEETKAVETAKDLVSWRKSLTKDQLDAVYAWTTSGSNCRNFRAADAGKALDAFGKPIGPKLKAALKDLKEALAKGVPHTGTIFRGLHEVSDPAQFVVGATITQDALASWTTDSGIAKDFATKYGSRGNVLMEVRTTSGEVRKTENNTEREVIAMKGFALKIEKVTETKYRGQPYLHVVASEVHTSIKLTETVEPPTPKKTFDKKAFAKTFEDLTSGRRVGKVGQTGREARQHLDALLNTWGMQAKDKGGSVSIRDLPQGINGQHAFGTGKIDLARHRAGALRRAVKGLAEGTTLDREAVDSLRTAIHETVHGHSPTQLGSIYRQPIITALEEATTEIAACVITSDLVNRPYSQVVRAYLNYRTALTVAVARAENISEAEALEAVKTASIDMRKDAEQIRGWQGYIGYFASKLPGKTGDSARAAAQKAQEKGKDAATQWREAYKKSNKFVNEFKKGLGIP